MWPLVVSGVCCLTTLRRLVRLGQNNMEVPTKKEVQLHAPFMGKISEEVGNVVVGVLGDYVMQDLRKEVKDLRNRLQHHVDFVEELLSDRKSMAEERVNMATPYPHCHFCYELVKTGGGVCPCGMVGHCSKECQKLDWKRNHKKVCWMVESNRGAAICRSARVVLEEVD